MLSLVDEIPRREDAAFLSEVEGDNRMKAVEKARHVDGVMTRRRIWRREDVMCCAVNVLGRDMDVFVVGDSENQRCCWVYESR